MRKIFENAESTEFSGMCIRALAHDHKLMAKSGKVLITGDLGHEYGLVDVDGERCDEYASTISSCYTHVKVVAFARRAC